jgi:DNA-binding response OmpR family regulator
MQLFWAEDDPRLARSYRRNLEDEGHIVDVAFDGETAFHRIVTAPAAFDVIILDILLPRRDGISVCRELRRAGIMTPILLLTALDQTEDKVAGLDAGADDYLTKPFPVDELLARLRALTRRARQFAHADAATQIVIGDLTIDRLRHEVWRAGHPIPLTVREFMLLEMLARNAGRVVTRGQLLMHIWPDGTEAASNVLDTYIHYLRDKIDRNATHKLISTVRGIGYMAQLPPEAGA